MPTVHDESEHRVRGEWRRRVSQEPVRGQRKRRRVGLWPTKLNEWKRPCQRVIRSEKPGCVDVEGAPVRAKESRDNPRGWMDENAEVRRRDDERPAGRRGPDRCAVMVDAEGQP